MAQAGADVLIPHMGLTTKGSIGAHTALTLGGSRPARASHARRRRKVQPDILVLCHGGPISEPEDAAVYPEEHARHRRLFWGSSIERLPTEIAITDCVRRFKGMKLNTAPH